MRHSTKHPRRIDSATLRGLLFPLASILCLIGFAADLGASVLIAPPVVVLSDNQRTGRMILRNPTDRPQEVSVDFKWGLPETDSLGNMSLQLVDSGVTDPHSALGWVRAFPRRIVMPPGSEQTVRFVARPPKELSDGEYWARIVVSSQNARPPEIGEIQEGVISARLNTIIQTAASLKYRHGDLVSKVEITDSWVERQDNIVSVFVDMLNLGNVSYLGVLDVRVLDADGNELTAKDENTAVYYDLRRRIDLPLPPEVTAEPASVVISLSTEGRRDIPSKDVIKGNAVDLTLAVE